VSALHDLDHRNLIKIDISQRRWIRAMPTYQYRCEECGEKFERIETISEP
jgi:hypothetical protein